MKHGFDRFCWWSVLALLIAAAPTCRAQQPSHAASDDFNRYVAAVDSRIEQEHRSAAAFLAGTDPDSSARLRQGEVIVERLTPEGGQALPGALLHDWRGTSFVPGGTVLQFESLLRNVGAYPKIFSPQVLQAKLLGGSGERFQMEMLVRQRHVIEVMLDGTYDVRVGRLDPEHGWTVSASSHINELGVDRQPLSEAAEHGFLWRLDTWWSYEQRDGGLYVQIESVSLTRSIPPGLGWMVGPFIENIPRESLEFTLHGACAALRGPANQYAQGRRMQ